ncbi:MAG: zinc ribbon domain-containing protein [Phycisphaerales bacterium]|jgi:hypothetical protein
MRHRREAKTPRRPRVITWRLVIVSLVVGVVLAAGSVVVGAAPYDPPGLPLPRQTTAFYFAGQHMTTAKTSHTIGADVRIWRMQYVGETGDPSAHRRAISNVVDEDPRPPAIAELLDEHGGGVMALETGWPLRAAHGRLHVTILPAAPAASPPGASASTPGLWMFRALGRDWSVPYLPLWPGLLGNTLFYGVLVLTPFSLVRWRRLRRRARRGLCPACGYELGDGVEACPECGLARVVARRRPAMAI